MTSSSSSNSEAETVNLFEVTDETLFKKQYQQYTHCVLYFWADWHQPCKQLLPVIKQLSIDHKKGLVFFTIDAEKYQNITQLFNVTAVPTTIFSKLQKEQKRLEASPAPSMVQAVNVFNQQSLTYKDLKSIENMSASSDASSAKPIQLTEADKLILLNKRIAKLIATAPVMLFMKGSPENPRCKFSRETMAIFKAQKVTEFGHFDILGDNSIRQGIKAYSNWKTFPQLYISSKLVGGVDIIKELIEENEFKSSFPSDYFAVHKANTDNSNTTANATETTAQLNERIRKTIGQHKTMLFMKGSPSQPRCGFSAKIVQILKENKVTEYGHFDILSDNAIRQGIKTYSNWPTFPQLYVNSELIGGLDVVNEMIADDEFQEVFEDK